MVAEHGDGESIFELLRSLLDGEDEDALRAFLADLHAADVADCLEEVSEEERSRIFFLLPPRTTAEAIVLLEEAVRSDVLEDFSDKQVSDVLKELPADDAVDVLDELDDEDANRIVEQLPPEQKAAVVPLRQYDEDTAGGIMNTDFVSVPLTGSVADAVNCVRGLTEEQKEHVYYIYCVDDSGKLAGVVPPLQLITSPEGLRVEKLLLDDLFTAHVNDDQEEVKNKFDKYDVVALPVVDDDFRMVGVITHDDVLEVAEEEAEEDMYHMAGTDAREFASSSLFHAAGIRARWLLPCLAGTYVAAVVGISFKSSFTHSAYAIIFPFLLPIAAMGGNAGVQISTVIVRALATEDNLVATFWRAAARELRIAVILGVGSGVCAAFATYAVTHSDVFAGAHEFRQDHGDVWRVALSVGLAMTSAILISGVLGLGMPFLFKRKLGIDPAIATGPVITTVNDATSAVIYLLIAAALLGGGAGAPLSGPTSNTSQPALEASAVAM